MSAPTLSHRPKAERGPAGFTDAAWHVDGIADSGVGYVVTHGWHLRCQWCSWEVTKPTKREAVEAYREHERARMEVYRQECAEDEAMITYLLTTDLTPLRPYEVEQGGYWLHPSGNTDKVWVPARLHDRAVTRARVTLPTGGSMPQRDDALATSAPSRKSGETS